MGMGGTAFHLDFLVELMRDFRRKLSRGLDESAGAIEVSKKDEVYVIEDVIDDVSDGREQAPSSNDKQAFETVSSDEAQ